MRWPPVCGHGAAPHTLVAATRASTPRRWPPPSLRPPATPCGMPTLGSVVAVAVAVVLVRLPWSGRCSKRAARVAMAMQGRPVVGTRLQVVVPPPPVPPPPSAVTVQCRVLGRLLASATGSSLTTMPVVRRILALQWVATTQEQRRLKTTGNSLKPRRCCSSCKASYVAGCMRGSVQMYAHVQTCVNLPVSLCVSPCVSLCLCVCVYVCDRARSPAHVAPTLFGRPH